MVRMRVVAPAVVVVTAGVLRAAALDTPEFSVKIN
jgi:hypothetical protein